MKLRRVALLALLAAIACSAGPSVESTGTASAAIENGSPATAFPEAVIVTSSGFVPCSGVVLAPRVVLTAGHCRSSAKKYSVSAPNAKHQVATGSSDWTTFDGQAATSSDLLLIFLDSDLQLDAYPTIPEEEVAPGTEVVDVGRTLNDVIMSDATYVSSTVTIQGAGDALGFHYNYEALPDVSQDGDSGGPIELVKGAAHTVVAIVDTDTVEQNITEATPIDLFTRLDLVRTEILAQIASHETQAAGPVSDAAPRDTGAGIPDSRAEGHDGGRSDAAAPTTSTGGGCDLGGGAGGSFGWLAGLGLVSYAAQRRRRLDANSERGRGSPWRNET